MIDGEPLISSRTPMLNSFVPNIVWLPAPISTLTDREGSHAQKLLQALSWRIYGGQILPKELLDTWKILQYPEGFPKISVDKRKMNYFEVPEKWLTKRITGLISEIETILSIKQPVAKKSLKIKSSRYLPSLGKIPYEQRSEMNNWLRDYKNVIEKLSKTAISS